MGKTWTWFTLKRAIHRCSKLEFLERREEKAYRQDRKPKKFGANEFEVVEIQKNSKSKTPSANSNLGPRCEASRRTKDLPTLAPRVEARNETRNSPCGGGGVKSERNCATSNLVSKQTLEHPRMFCLIFRLK
ncbi:hypothetical protein AVEN_22016-1 [Araneus ventricosus]|uniref:Uncharacterized protein n=1 Tax=Araneus ventricosus TaxID=182803 RepID=A0A4Y2HSH9_ARAVE|nr:hypothetical protein AVEN_22016-1 [Araneus ventricosus]